MSGVPLLLAVTKPHVGPKVPISRRPISHLMIAGLAASDFVILHGRKGDQLIKIREIKENGRTDLYPDDYIGCDSLWAERCGNISLRVYVWLE